jgi:hypothetical protein
MKETMKELPLTDQDFDGIRKAVLETIEARAARRKRFVYSLEFAFAALVLVVGGWWVRSATQPQPLTRPSATLSPLRGARGSRLPAPLIATSQLRDPLTPRPPHHRHPAPKHESVLAAASDANPIRLELATADPDIRIIWISNPTESR